MQASQTSPFDYPAGPLHPNPHPSRPAPPPSFSSAPSHFASSDAQPRQPRMSSLLPPPHLVPQDHDQEHVLLQPSVYAAGDPSSGRPDDTSWSLGQAPPDPATRSPEGNTTSLVNRWSASTASNRGSSVPASRESAPRAGRRTSSVDTTFLLGSSPSSSSSPPTKTPTRKLQKSRPRGDSYERDPSPLATRTPARAEPPPQQGPYVGLPSFEPLPSLSQDYSTALRDRQPNHRLSRSLGQPIALDQSINRQQQTLFSTDTDPMHKEQTYDHRRAHGHSRSHSGKGGSGDSAGRPPKQPSQKAMLSHALQKANAAVQLDNSQDVVGARYAYGEACDLLHNVLQRTSAQEDKRKLEAIRRTYSSRIEELDQMLAPGPDPESKALPAFPGAVENTRDVGSRQGSRQGARRESESTHAETATLATVVRDENHRMNDPSTNSIPQTRPSRADTGSRQSNRNPTPVQQINPPEPGFLQSSFSRSPARSPYPGASPIPPEDQPQSAGYNQPRSRAYYNAEDGTGRTDSSGSQRVTEHSHHAREDSQNSWLDPIDESGGSTASSVHSRTSSLGYRRRHIRSTSGDTEAEFDTALDAAIEAAYDDGYEPMDPEDIVQADPDEEIVANALRRVELARQRVRQTEREAYEMASDMERERFQLNPRLSHLPVQPEEIDRSQDFYDDNSSDEEERMLEEMTRDYANQYGPDRGQQRQVPVPRESDSSGVTSHTWQSSIGSNPPGTGNTSLSTVTEVIGGKSGLPKVPPAPRAPPPSQALPDIPQPRPAPSSQTVRSRRLSGQNPKQLKIETTGLGPPLPLTSEDASESKTGPSIQEAIVHVGDTPRTETTGQRPMSPETEAKTADARTTPISPSASRTLADGDDRSGGRSASPSVNKLKKNFSSSSLRSLRTRNMSLSHLDEGGEMSPGTPSSSQWGSSRTPAIPAIPTSVAANLRDKADTAAGGMHLLDDHFHSPESPGSPDQASPDAPLPLEPCPTDYLLRPFWLMRCLYQTLVHPRGGYLSSKLFVPRDAWNAKGAKLKNVDDKIANCDYLTAALLKLARVDTFDADAVLEEMQSMESVLELTQANLTRKLGNEVGVNGAGNLFKEALVGVDVDAAPVPRSASVSGKSSSFSWRRLRSKNSSTALSTSNRRAADDTPKDGPNTLATLPMTAQPTSKPAKRDLNQVQFTGANAHYMGSLARLFDAVQVIDQIARQVEDPGLRHADKTQVGLEFSTRHAAEFFGFYICRFVLADLGILLDKYIKRGSEWVLA